MTINMNPGLTEKFWPTIVLSPIYVDGHVITVPDTAGLKVKQTVTLSKLGLSPENFEIKRVIDCTRMVVGPVGKNIKQTSDATKFDGGSLAANEQSRNVLGDAPILRAVYEEEPTIAFRTIEVSHQGSPISTAKGQIETIEPDATFVYDTKCNLTKIREKKPSLKRYEGNIIMSTNGYAVVDTYHPWMNKGETFFFGELKPNNTLNPLGSFEVVSLNDPCDIKLTDITTQVVEFDAVNNCINFTNIPGWVQPDRWVLVSGSLNDGQYLQIESVVGNSAKINPDGVIVNDNVTVTLDGTKIVLKLDNPPLSNFDDFGVLDGSLGDKVKVTNFRYNSKCTLEQVWVTYDCVEVADIITGWC